MAISTHVEQLKQKHLELEQKLEEAIRHPSIGDDVIADLKRKKLALKDKIRTLDS